MWFSRTSSYGLEKAPWGSRWYAYDAMKGMGIYLPLPVYWVAWWWREFEIWRRRRRIGILRRRAR
jgi:hypothetical protein